MWVMAAHCGIEMFVYERERLTILRCDSEMYGWRMGALGEGC
jgi:hypothetical protein